MGTCQTKSKLKSHKDLQHHGQQRKTDPLLTNNNPSVVMHTFSPNQEAISEPNDDTKRNVNSLKVYKFSYTRFYSEISQGNQTLLNHQKLVQHNLTGKIRIVEIYERNSINEQFINDLSQKPPDHPRISTIYELFVEDEQYSLIVDYCSGGLLSNYYSSKQVISFAEQEISTIIYQMGEALRYLQKIGITHGHLTLNCFSRIDHSHEFQIKLTDIRGLYIKSQIDMNNVITLSPEACKNPNHYDYSRDLWSVGVIAYHMICGYPPFEGNTITSVKTQIKKSAAIYNNFQFDRTSKSCSQLIEKILVPIKSRISLEAFLNDQWFKIKIKQNDQNIIKKLEQNKVKISQLQQQFLLFMIKNFCSSDQQQLYNEFVLLDENQDGQLTKQELLKVYSTKFDSKAEAVTFIDNIFKVADSDKSGTIDFGEFLVAITDKPGLLTDNNLKIAFKMLASSNGQLTPEKLKFHFGMSKARLEKLFAEHFPKNQIIGFLEFENLMKQLL